MAVTVEQRLRALGIYKRNRNILAEGVRMVQAAWTEPAATAGVLAGGFPAWQPGRTYALNETFSYEGMLGFSRQAGLTAQAIYPPFSTGTESLYGVRPAPDEDGIYPYVYNMAVVVGMLVRDGENVYRCIQAANPLLYAPGDAPSLFVVVESESETEE